MSGIKAIDFFPDENSFTPIAESTSVLLRAQEQLKKYLKVKLTEERDEKKKKEEEEEQEQEQEQEQVLIDLLLPEPTRKRRRDVWAGPSFEEVAKRNKKIKAEMIEILSAFL